MKQGTVYLLHFDRPFKHARHYLGTPRKGQHSKRGPDGKFSKGGSNGEG